MGPTAPPSRPSSRRSCGAWRAVLPAAPDGALYRFNWVFPSEKPRVKGGGTVGFGGANGTADLLSFAHLEGEALDARLACPLRDHPLLLVPRRERRKLLEEKCHPAQREGGAATATSCSPTTTSPTGELCHFCQQIFAALLASYHGDYMKVLRHVQVERFYVSMRYLEGAVTVEPQLSVDASWRQVSADRSAGSLPTALQTVALFEPAGPLVSANRGLLEFADLLKRPPEAFKYLLVDERDRARRARQLHPAPGSRSSIASANEKQLVLQATRSCRTSRPSRAASSSFACRTSRRWHVEKEIVYDQQVTRATVGKHVAPHAHRGRGDVGGPDAAQEAHPRSLPGRGA